MLILEKKYQQTAKTIKITQHAKEFTPNFGLAGAV